MSSIKDAVVDCILERLRNTKVFDLRLTNLVFENTPDSSPLRRLWCDVYVLLGNATWLEDSTIAEPINVDWMKQLIQRQYRASSRPGLDKSIHIETCTYHEHGNRECYVVSTLIVIVRFANENRGWPKSPCQISDDCHFHSRCLSVESLCKGSSFFLHGRSLVSLRSCRLLNFFFLTEVNQPDYCCGTDCCPTMLVPCAVKSCSSSAAGSRTAGQGIKLHAWSTLSIFSVDQT